ncbi:putative membrane protein [Cucumis melo var. makuwa]|uniref:Membrane protein n=1 Tax=Cucumis melo var. makuwa TaxID=1194695 RepID=A0A5A7VHC5_CUCMM|nr:putative membrane protein [Cucumis melo var. makuwa]
MVRMMVEMTVWTVKFKMGDFEGHSKYVAVGDERGRIYVFVRNGDVAIELPMVSESPITAMVSYMSIYKNETLLVSGHKNGAILMHRDLGGIQWRGFEFDFHGTCCGICGHETVTDFSIGIASCWED